MAKRLQFIGYKLVPLSPTVSFTDDAGPVEVMINGFRCVLTANGLTAEPVGDLQAEYNGVPPTFRIADPIRSGPKWRIINAREASEIHSGVQV